MSWTLGIIESGSAPDEDRRLAHVHFVARRSEGTDDLVRVGYSEPGGDTVVAAGATLEDALCELLAARVRRRRRNAVAA